MNKSELVYIALGSNKGDSWSFLNKAKDLLKQISLGEWSESFIYESIAVGPGVQTNYLNQVICFRTNFTPQRLLHYCKGIEIRLGRKKTIFWGNREIDLDLLYIGDVVYESYGLKIPHPLIEKRAFVLTPLADIAKTKIDPRNGLNIWEMLDHLKPQLDECWRWDK